MATPAIPPFKNTYFAMRHGESIPNTRGVILSDPAEGERPENTLTPHGEEQASAAIRAARTGKILDDHTVILSSPFSRCVRTAQIAKAVLGVKDDVALDNRLRERWFGDWEGTSNANYAKIWAKDSADPQGNHDHSESAAEVAERVIALVGDLEHRYAGKNILLVSHGDALQILQTYFSCISPGIHRDLPHLGVAELRRLN